MTVAQRLAYFPGCSLETSAKEYDESARAACAAIGIELEEPDDWSCCGASSVHSGDGMLEAALPARTLAKVAQMKSDVAVCCPDCFSQLKLAQRALKDHTQRQRISSAIGAPAATNGTQVVPVLKLFESKLDSLPVKMRLEGLKAVAYYGCKWVRPHKLVESEDESNPMMLDRVMSAVGVEMLDWGFKTECCGASLGLSRPESVVRLSGRILSAAKRAGAECVVVACPLCQQNLDARQRDIERSLDDKLRLPVIYFTQLLGLSFGVPLKRLMFERHFVDPRPLLQANGFLKA